jgi:transposase
MSQMPESPATAPIPVQLSEPEFIAFIFPHLSMPRRGPKCKLGYHRVFNLILWVLYTGMQWKCLPVPEAGDGTAVIHYTTVYKVFAKWSDDGSLDQAFIASVRHLAEQNHLDLSVLHGDGSNTVAKKGGDGIGYSGHKHQKGEKVVAIVENNGFVLAPLPVAPVNEADTVLLPDGLNALKRVARLTDLKIDGSYLNLDGGFDSRRNRKAIFNAGLVPNVKENPRNRKAPKRGRKRLFNAAIHSLRLCVERTFAWEDKFKRLLLRFEFKQQRHYGMKLMAYTLINLRHFCGA